MFLESMFPSITVLAYLVTAALLVAAFLCLSGTTRQAWALKETALGVLMLALAFLAHGIFVVGAATFGPTPVLQGEVFGFRCGIPIDSTDCKSVDVSTGRGYLVDARLPQPVHFDTFYRGNRQVTVQVSTWDGQIHWMRTDNTNPPTTVGSPSTISYLSVGEVLAGLASIYLAFVVWREAKRRGITNECDPLLMLRRP